MSGKAILKEIGSTLLYIVVVLGITWLVITFVGQRTEVNGSSMEPTLSNNDNLIVDKISYRFKDPQRFDIIVFPFQYDENVYYIKRIIGLPGETVEIISGKVYINGELLDEPYLSEEPTGDFGPYQVPEDSYFMLGDNRAVSKDSRYWHNTYVKKDKIIAKAFVMYWPSLKWLG